MPAQDTKKIKDRILSFIRMKGPSLPVHIAKDIGLSTLFTSAFLSELLSEKKLKLSDFKVGNSPVYFLKGQEARLEPFFTHLNVREKEAFQLLKEKGFLKDKEQEPVVRVALRAIKDFALPVHKDGELYWKYFLVEGEFLSQTPEPKKEEPVQEVKEVIKKQEPEEKIEKEPKKMEELVEQKPSLQESEPFKKESSMQEKNEGSGRAEDLEIFDESKEEPKKTTIKKKSSSKKTSSKGNDKFFNRVKEYLNEKNIELLDIVGFSKQDLVLKIKDQDKEFVLIAYNKKALREEDILKAFKKASEMGLPYRLLGLGDPLKKVTQFIRAVEQMDKIEKMG